METHGTFRSSLQRLLGYSVKCCLLLLSHSVPHEGARSTYLLSLFSVIILQASRMFPPVSPTVPILQYQLGKFKPLVMPHSASKNKLNKYDLELESYLQHCVPEVIIHKMQWCLRLLFVINSINAIWSGPQVKSITRQSQKVS